MSTEALVAELRDWPNSAGTDPLITDRAADTIEQLQRERDDVVRLCNGETAKAGELLLRAERAESALAAATAEREGLEKVLDNCIGALRAPLDKWKGERQYMALEAVRALAKAKGAT